jgi:hypothetical protein
VTPYIRYLLLTVAVISFRDSTAQGMSKVQVLCQPPRLTASNIAGGEEHSMRDMDSMPGMSAIDHPMNSGGHEWCGDVAWSTFNHRVAGWFLVLWGLAALVAGLKSGSSRWRFVPPLVLLALAEFLFFRNDPEAWPVGPMSFWASLHDPEDFQHRIFLLLVVLLAVVELLRAAERLPRLFARYALPGLGAFGAVYLFFHKHSVAMGAMMHHTAESGMSDDLGMQRMFLTMNLIRHEHLWFSVLGFALITCKLLADTGRLKSRWGASLWCVLAIVLGAYMTRYVE